VSAEKKYRLPEPLEKHGGRLSSGSQLNRTMACPLSELLPHTALAPPWIAKAGLRGTALHKALEHMGSLRAYEETAEEYHKEIGEMDYSKAVGRFVDFNNREIKFCYDLRTKQVTHLPKEMFEKDRDYGAVEAYQATCTLDVLIPGASHFEVWDYKSPKGRNAEKKPRNRKDLDEALKHYLPVEKNVQLLFGALCAKILVCPLAETFTVGIQHVPSMEVWKATLPVSVLTEFEQELLAAYQEAEGQAWDFEVSQVVRPNPGKHCDLCPARYECPKPANDNE
jgi:hypothetical protein